MPVAGLFAVFSSCDHSRSGSCHAGPASSSSTSRPRAASSFATTGPPPPAPTTITSRTPVALEFLVAVQPGRVAREPMAARRRIREERDQLLEVADEEADRPRALHGQALERREHLRLLGSAELGERRAGLHLRGGT